MPGNDVYVVQGRRRYMIPVVRQFVDEPDYEAGTINVRLIEGMQTDAN
jgi:ribosomal 30S subunit maturation factor RimM